MPEVDRSAPTNSLNETLVERIERAVGRLSAADVQQTTDVRSPELALIDAELARSEPPEPIWARAVERPIAPPERPAPPTRVPPSANTSEDAIVDRREALASVLQGLSQDLKSLADSGTTDLTEGQPRHLRGVLRLPPPFPVGAPAASTATDRSVPLAPPKRRRRGRGAVLALALVLLFGAGVLLLPSAHWFRSTHTQVAPSRPSASAVGGNLSARTSGPRPNRAVARLAAHRPHVFGWVAVPQATYYRVRFFRAGEEVFEATPVQPRIVLPARWRFAGRERSLVPGTYHWVVQPGFGPAQAQKYGNAIVVADWIAAP